MVPSIERAFFGVDAGLIRDETFTDPAINVSAGVLFRQFGQFFELCEIPKYLDAVYQKPGGVLAFFHPGIFVAAATDLYPGLGVRTFHY